MNIATIAPFEECRQIPLTKGKHAIVDSYSYDFLMRWEWYVTSAGYAARTLYIGLSREKEVKRIIYMHRVLAGCPDDLEVDHIDRNPLNNTISNLRICDQSINKLNRSLIDTKTSKYRGVSRAAGDSKWNSYIGVKGKTHYVGRFENEDDAAIAWNEAAKKMHGKYAMLNIIVSQASELVHCQVCGDHHEADSVPYGCQTGDGV